MKYCNDWLAVALSLLRKRVTASSPAPADRIAQVPGDEEAPLEEEGENSRYAPLASWLQRVRPEVNDLAVDFEQVEKLLGSQLPPSARKHAAWWANDAATHVQSRAWLNSGWRVESVDLGEEVVQFGRLRDRAEAYRVFFGDLAARLARLDSPLRPPEPRGRNWMDIVSLPPGKSLGRVAFAFTRRRSARVELYIDCGDRARNKALFELLHGDAEALASECGEARLSWEKLDDARASRVAAYRPIFITDREKLPELLSWAEQTVPRFVEAFSRRLASAAKAV